MIDILGMKLDDRDGRGHKVPGSHVWMERHGTVEVDGEQWHGHLFFFASPLDSEVSESDAHQFHVGRFKSFANDGWNTTAIVFASPFGNLVIDSPGGDAECVECCTVKESD